MTDTKEINATAELKLPKKVDDNLGKALVTTASAIKDITSSCSKVVNLITDGSCTLLAPIAAHLKGKSYEIACKYLPYQNQVEIRKELSQIKAAQYVLENLVDKVQKGEEIPHKIEDTDTLFTIQNAASETTDEDFIRFWAKLYTEEACKPNTISKKTVNLCKDLNKDVVQILENNIFPYCEGNGFYFGDSNKNIESIIIAEEYGFIRTSGQKFIPKYIDTFIDTPIGQYYLYICPGYEYTTYYEGKILTNSALEVRESLKLKKNINVDNVLSKIQKSATIWEIAENFKPYINYKNGETRKFFITENNKVVYPVEQKGKDIGEIYREILSNIEYKEGANQFFAPDGRRLTMHC